ncbi:hypothetical protein DFH27DRAFT_571796 [Peziza echinospora]|nr:hypothetical protein DFH27DRAFT_571796 [Peziza echinospora]
MSLSPTAAQGLQALYAQLAAAQLQVAALLAGEGFDAEGLPHPQVPVYANAGYSNFEAGRRDDCIDAGLSDSHPIQQLSPISPGHNAHMQLGVHYSPAIPVQHQPTVAQMPHVEVQQPKKKKIKTEQDHAVTCNDVGRVPTQSAKKRRSIATPSGLEESKAKKKKAPTPAPDCNAVPQGDVANLREGTVSYDSIEQAADALSLSIPHVRSQFMHQEFAVEGTLARVIARSPKCARCQENGQKCWVLSPDETRLGGGVCGNCRRLAQSCKSPNQ